MSGLLLWLGLTFIFAVPVFYQATWTLPVGAGLMIAGAAIMLYNFLNAQSKKKGL